MFKKLYYNFVEVIRRRRYRRLYYRLFWFYAERCSTVFEAGSSAADAFQWLTLNEWPEWASLNLPEYHQPNRK